MAHGRRESSLGVRDQGQGDKGSGPHPDPLEQSSLRWLTSQRLHITVTRVGASPGEATGRCARPTAALLQTPRSPCCS